MNQLQQILTIPSVKTEHPRAHAKATHQLAQLVKIAALLQFAVNNKQNFTEHDSDGVIGAWIEQAEKALSALDDES